MTRFVTLLTLLVAAPLSRSIGYADRSSARSLLDSKLNNPELQRAWAKFSRAVQTNDLPALHQLSAGCIACIDCVTNTPAEATAFETYQKKHPNTWYDTLYGSLGFIPTQAFWQRDGRLIFDAKTKSRLLNSAKLRFAANDHNKAGYVAPCLILPAQAASTHVYEVLLTYIDPYPGGRGEEGMQKAFAFVKTKQGYKFCGYSTIP
ncbi:MAG: hypothetical protein EOO55_02535 [Hymenobacter sp.]|nr:MAG: hypothetical protein EOO55_02535 [Hymenobacter sp.]